MDTAPENNRLTGEGAEEGEWSPETPLEDLLDELVSMAVES